MPNQADFQNDTRDYFPVPRLKHGSYLQVYQGRGGAWRWRHRAANHRVLAQGEGYTRRRDAVRGAHRAVPGVEVR